MERIYPMEDKARKEFLQEVYKKLDQVEEERRKGANDIPAEEVSARMRAAIEVKRRNVNELFLRQ